MTFKKEKSMKIKENKQCVVRKWVRIVLPFYLFTFLPLSAQEPQDPPAPWDGSVSSSLQYDMDNNILIYTPADLAALNALWDDYDDGDRGYKDYTILLMNDLDMNNINFNGHTIGWDEDHKFGGTFDGQGHIIRNLKIEGNDNNRGLFGKMDNGRVKNLKLVNVDIHAGDGDDCHIGAICGRMYNHSTIEHCAVVGGSVRQYESGNDEFGAICGYMTAMITPQASFTATSAEKSSIIATIATLPLPVSAMVSRWSTTSTSTAMTV